MYKPETATRTDNLLERMSRDLAGGEHTWTPENFSIFFEYLEKFPNKSPDFDSKIQ